MKTQISVSCVELLSKETYKKNFPSLSKAKSWIRQISTQCLYNDFIIHEEPKY